MVQFNPLVVGWPFNQSNKGVWASHFSLLLGMGGLLILFCFLFFSLSWGPSVALLVSSTFPIPLEYFFLSLQPLSESLPLSPLSLFLCVSISFSLSSHLSVCLSSSSQSLSLVTLFLQPTVNLSLCVSQSLSFPSQSFPPPSHLSPASLSICISAVAPVWPLVSGWSLQCENPPSSGTFSEYQYWLASHSKFRKSFVGSKWVISEMQTAFNFL